ncbi:TVP38/TMEM64 family protein [Candidatus Peregrinibacteria bacterium]|nr:MAG: TVP38/TMEM64 family protein [Candidatus Peregrinibacteria bacterium]
MSKKRTALILTFLGIFFLVIFLIKVNGVQHFFSEENQEKIRTFLRSAGPIAPFLFVAGYYIATLSFLSTLALTILAGVLFGKAFGAFLVIIAATAAAQTAFLITRYFGKNLPNFVEKKEMLSTFTEKIEERLLHNGLQTFIILRCLLLPYAPVSYAAGLVKTAKARDFFWATLLTNAVLSPAFVFFGDAITKGPKALLLPGILIVFVLLVPQIIKKLTAQKTSS